MQVTQSCPNLCDPMGYTVRGILRARVLEWVGKPFPSLRDLPNPAIKPRSPTSQVDSLPAETQGKQWRRGANGEWFLPESYQPAIKLFFFFKNKLAQDC